MPEAAGDEETAAFIRDVIACLGGTADASGRTGITGEDIDCFQTAVCACLEWRSKGGIPPGESTTPVMPLGGEHAGGF